MLPEHYSRAVPVPVGYVGQQVKFSFGIVGNAT